MNTTKSSKDGHAFHTDGKLDGQAKDLKEKFPHNVTEKLNESTKAFEKGFSDVNENVMDMYTKQLNLMTGFYNNFLNPIISNNKGWNIGQDFGSNLFNTDLTKAFSNPFNGMGAGSSNPFLSSFDKMYKQMMGYNHNLLLAFNSQANGNHIDWSEISKKYMETVENRLEASKSIFNSISEACNAKVNSSIEANKKAMEEISSQFNLVIKQNQKFWADMLEMYQAPLHGENKNSKESTHNETKKHATAHTNS